MTLQLISVALMLSNFNFFFGPLLSGTYIQIGNSQNSVFRNNLLKEIRAKVRPLYSQSIWD